MPVTRDAAGDLCLGGVRLEDAVADVGTPAYVYDLDAMAAGVTALRAAFDGAPHLVAYAVKANSAGPVVRALAGAGAGADVVSGGELELALAAGVAPGDVVFSGVAKTDDELDLAIARGVRAVHVESVEEVTRLAARAAASRATARLAVRLNPAVAFDVLDTHAGIATGHDEAKFGVALVDVPRVLDEVRRAQGALQLVGVTVHAGSQLAEVRPYEASARVVFDVARELRKEHPLRYVDSGGGFGVDYGGRPAEPPAAFVRAVRAAFVEAGLEGLDHVVEPGRSLVAAHGVLVAGVLQDKATSGRRFRMIDAGMNDLVRPAMYQARHRVEPLEARVGDEGPVRVVGPVCESSDDFGVHELPARASRRVALLDAGAYGYTMASLYNGRAFAAEVFLSGGRVVGATPRRPASAWVADRLAAGR